MEKETPAVWHIALCDDEQPEREHLERLVREYFDQHGLACQIELFSSGEALLAHRGRDFDLVFLDIYMGLSDGMTVARRLRALDKTCLIIFATSSKAHAIRGYGVRALHYLVKPFGPAQLGEALDLAVEELTDRQAASIQIGNRQGTWRVRLADLIYVESAARVLTVHTRTQGDIQYYDKLDVLEAACADARFLRCHKSYLVNLDFVQAIVNERIRLLDGREVPVSVGMTLARERFASHLAGNLPGS